MTYCFPEPFEWKFCGTCGAPLVYFSDGERERPYCCTCHRYYYRNPVPACCLFICDDQGRLLFGKRAVEPCLGAWTLPGGFMELGETGEQCALREMREETGLIASHAELLGVSVTSSKINGSILVLGYIIREWHGILSPDSDISDLRFSSKEDRPPVPFDAHRELLELYDKLNP